MTKINDPEKTRPEAFKLLDTEKYMLGPRNPKP